mmetsp:Transcript_5247/g.15029  ORF Transcript_5247/g.15029 Transcript_5247/m.15029 type:complete len:321 (+) Transcript_5247:219-1181(+)
MNVEETQMGHSNWKRRPCYVCCGALIVLALWLVPEWYQATGSQHKQWQQSSRTGESRDSTRARHSQMAEVALEDLQGLRPRTEGAYKGRHAKHVKIIQTRKRGFDFVIYGDSITAEIADAIPGLHQDTGTRDFWENYHSAAWLGIGGEFSGSLLWRLLNGELPDKAHQPTAAIVLIGINDLNEHRTLHQESDPIRVAPDTVKRKLAMVKLLRAKLPQTHVIVVDVLPRGAVDFEADGAGNWPNEFTNGIRYINKHMEVALKGVDEKVSTLDCTDLFMSEDGQSLSKDLWRTDLLHHNDQGKRVLLECYRDELAMLGLTND